MAALAESGLSLSASLNDDALDSGDGGLDGLGDGRLGAASVCKWWMFSCRVLSLLCRLPSTGPTVGGPCGRRSGAS